MKIAAVDIFPIQFRRGSTYLGDCDGATETSNYYFRPEYRSLYSRYQETLFVKITTSCGIVGWGEALAPVGPEVSGEIIKRLFSPFLIGSDPHDIDVIWNRLYASMRERGYFTGFMVDAISAVDVALWDIVGKSLNTPVYKLLGGAYRKRIPAYVSGLPKERIEDKIALALEWKEKGFTAIKLHLGYDVRTDTEIVEQIRDAVGADFRLMVDAHWKYTVPEAIRLGRHLERLGVEFLEAPTEPEDVDGTAEIARALDIAVAIGEAKRTRYQFKERLMKRSGDILQPDAGRTGITEMRKIANLAESFHTPIAPHLSVGLGVCIAATLHVSAAMHNFYMLEYQPSVLPVANHFLAEPLLCEAGYYKLPEGPGLGIEIDEQKVIECTKK